MKKVFYIDGGAGRVIAAIPALEKYVRNHPDEDVRILIGGWDNLLWGNQLLEPITYNPDTKGIFREFLSDADVFITPEPYRVPGYFNQKLSLAEAFDVEINGTNDHSDIGKPHLYLSKREELMAVNLIGDVAQQQGKKHTIVIQPFGRSAVAERGVVIDDSSRSMESNNYLSLVKKLSTKYNLILFAEQNMYLPEDTYTFKTQADLRGWMSIIEAADYFVGCDSVGQHMARAFDKPGTVVIGSTYAINTTYPDWFQVYEKPGVEKTYSPIRICGLDSHVADRYNDTCIDLSDEQVNELFLKIVKDIEKKVK